MDRINKILCHPLFIKYMTKNADMELDRIFCKHNLSHVMDVARISYILVLEGANGLVFGEKITTKAGGELLLTKDVIYAAALLHDIGRHIQYETGEKHAKLGAEMAPEILRDCGYTEAEIEAIVSAILTHSDKSIANEFSLNGILAKADMLSRACYACEAKDACNWPADEKNEGIVW